MNLASSEPLVLPDDSHNRALVGAYVAGHFRESIAKSTRGAVGGGATTTLSKKDWARADSIVLANPTVDANMLQEADRLVDSTWHGQPPGEVSRSTLLPLFGALGFVFFMLVFSVAAAIIARRGLAMRLLGLDLINEHGEPAGRLRLLWRQVLIVVPLGALAMAPLAILLDSATLPKVAMGVAAFAVVAANVVTAYRTPSRGLTERLSGTRMIPE